MKTVRIIFVLTLLALLSCKREIGFEIKSIEDRGSHLEIKINDGTYLIKPYNSKIIETSFIPNGEEFNPNSHTVILNPAKVATELTTTENAIEYKTSGITVSIQKEPFKISYTYKNKPIISEKGGYSKIENGESIEFELDSTEVLYGGGARALGMNRRGNRLQLYNKAHYGYETHSELMNYTMPLLMSSKIYAIHFDNAPIGYLDLDSKRDNTLTYETISGRKTYQVIVGDSWLDLIDNYTDLTGKQPLPPRWALGNFSSRFGYHSQSETETTIKAFKDEEIPVDAIIIDIYWFGKDIQGHMGNLEFFKDSFPNPKQMIRSFKDQGIKTVLVTEPFILSTSNRWKEVVDEDILAKDSIGNPYRFDFYFGNSGLIDIYNPRGKQWFWNIYKGLADLGVEGIWGDLGEPELHPSGLLHTTGTADEVHNIYGHDWARLVYEGYQKDFPNKRPFILMRSGFSGSQRFGLIPWSGDVNRTWGGLQSQPEIALQMAMQGLGYMHSDLGGFAGANLDNELYTRWLQYGVFQPIYRPHAQEEVPSEPVFREPKTKALAKQSIELRYKLLPYNYTIAHENSQTGTPLMRPLFFEEPDNESLFGYSDAYFWGNDFLISPILKPGIEEQEVHFPKKNIWFDFYTDERIEGGQIKMVKAEENSIPTYVRAGAFIPLAKPMQNIDNYDSDIFSLHYYHDTYVQTSKGNMYNDDGVSTNAEAKGKFEKLFFNSEFENEHLKLEFKSQIGLDYKVKLKQINTIIHNIQSKPKRVMIKEEEINFSWNSIGKTLTIPIQWDSKDKLELIIKL